MKGLKKILAIAALTMTSCAFAANGQPTNQASAIIVATLHVTGTCTINQGVMFVDGYATAGDLGKSGYSVDVPYKCSTGLSPTLSGQNTTIAAPGGGSYFANLTVDGNLSLDSNPIALNATNTDQVQRVYVDFKTDGQANITGFVIGDHQFVIPITISY
jgi:hypothetical protein